MIKYRIKRIIKSISTELAENQLQEKNLNLRIKSIRKFKISTKCSSVF